MKTLLSSLWNKFVNGQPVTEGEHPLKTKRNGAFVLGFLACIVLLFLWSVVIWPAIQRSVCRTIPTCIMPAVSLRIEHAKAAEPELHFGGKLPEYEIDLPFGDTDRTKYDLDKLSQAVAVAETGGCTDGTALNRRNCHGIMGWKYVDRPCGGGVPGICKQLVRFPRYFKSFDASHAEFKRIWAKSYKAFPDIALANKYTGKDRTANWLRNVCSAYPHPSCVQTLKAL